MGAPGWFIVIVVVLVMVSGVLALLGMGIRQKRLEDLRENGEIITAKVVRFKEVRRSSGSHQQTIHILVAEWTDPKTGHTRTFTTERLGAINYKIGQGVPVLLDRQNPDRYEVDI
ncbi:MAG TPA: DUF3592 domain-containing protein [Ktedonobacterales bacterium]|jgi:hypothetical protein